MDKKTTDIVAYITPIGWLIAFIAGDKEGAKFHLNQSLVLILAALVEGVCGKILGGLFGGIPMVGTVVSLAFGLIGLGLFALWILGLVYAIQGEEKRVPLLGEITLLK